MVQRFHAVGLQLTYYKSTVLMWKMSTVYCECWARVCCVSSLCAGAEKDQTEIKGFGTKHYKKSFVNFRSVDTILLEVWFSVKCVKPTQVLHIVFLPFQTRFWLYWISFQPSSFIGLHLDGCCWQQNDVNHIFYIFECIQTVKKVIFIFSLNIYDIQEYNTYVFIRMSFQRLLNITYLRMIFYFEIVETRLLSYIVLTIQHLKFLLGNKKTKTFFMIYLKLTTEALFFQLLFTPISLKALILRLVTLQCKHEHLI